MPHLPPDKPGKAPELARDVYLLMDLAIQLALVEELQEPDHKARALGKCGEIEGCTLRAARARSVASSSPVPPTPPTTTTILSAF